MEQTGAYQNEIFSPEVSPDQSSPEHGNVRAIAAMTTFGVNQPSMKPEHAVSRLAQTEMYTLDLSHPNTAYEQQNEETANASSSTDCLEFDGSDFSDDDFFFDDFDDFYPNESVI